MLPSPCSHTSPRNDFEFLNAVPAFSDRRTDLCGIVWWRLGHDFPLKSPRLGCIEFSPRSAGAGAGTFGLPEDHERRWSRDEQISARGEMEQPDGSFVGNAVKKFFKGYGYFHGIVESYDQETGYFTVKYTDGDTEELELKELVRLLIMNDNAKRPRGRPRKTESRKRKILPEVADPDQSPEEGSVDEVAEVKQQEGSPGKRARLFEQELSGAGNQEGSKDQVVTVDVPGASPEPEVIDDENEPMDEDSFRVPDIWPLPSSSVNYKVPAELLLDMLSTYAFLRSFSSNIFLSPFPFEVFVQALSLKEANPVVDHIHLSLLCVLRKHLERLAEDGVESAAKCLRCRDWKLLDIVTWPCYLVAYLLSEGYSEERQEKIASLGIFKGEYYELESRRKINILSFLCDRSLDTEVLREELGRRTSSEEAPELTPFSKTRPSDVDQSSKYQTRSSIKRLESGIDAESPDTSTPPKSLPTEDWNNDDCVLCGMDGNLLCCDGCPAAYHPRCVGISKAMLPEGNWFCPECVLIRNTKGGRKPSKGLRGFELLGIDHYRRRYISGANHIFVSESSATESNYVCYSLSDIPSMLEFLQQEGSLSATLQKSIRKLLVVLPDSPPPSNATSNCSFNEAGNEKMVPDRKSSVKRNEKTSSSQELIPDACLYVNQYACGASASLAASLLGAGVRCGEGSAQKAQIAEQIKAFCQAPIRFYWPSFKKKKSEASRDKCGWCFPCKYTPSRKRGCLLNIAAGRLSAGVALVAGGLRPLKKGSNNFWALSAYILYMEDRLSGLLVGPWESIDHRKRWKKGIEHADNVQQLKSALIELESSLRDLAFSRHWRTCPEDAPRPISNGVVRRSGRRKINIPRSELLVEFSWEKGGLVSRKFFDWETLPTKMLHRAARQGGVKKIPGLLYTNELLEIPRRTAHCAWRARVESSSTVPDLALQVRYLDALIRWTELSVPEDLKASRNFSDTFIREKSVEGDSIMYLVESCKTEEELRSCLRPDVVNSPTKFFQLVAGEDDKCPNRVWLSEAQVPLGLIRDFEEKRRCRAKSGKPMKARKAVLKMSRSEKFRLLVNKLLNAEVKRMKALSTLRCGTCNLEIDVSFGVQCAKCKGTFHPKCFNRFMTDVCHNCFKLSQSKRTPRPKPQKWKLESKQQLLVYSRRKIKPDPSPALGNSLETVVVRKKRSNTRVNVGGVQWKRSFETEVTYRQEKVVHPGECDMFEAPVCAVCNQLYDPSSLYVGCESCGAWFHGLALGVTESNVDNIAAFRCHKCRRRAAPLCPYSADKENEAGICLLKTRLVSSDEEDEGVLSEIGNWASDD